MNEKTPFIRIAKREDMPKSRIWMIRAIAFAVAILLGALIFLIAGTNPFTLDSKAPTGDYKEFMMREVRYNSLMRANPERANVLFDKAVANSKKRYEDLVGLVEYYKKEYCGE